MIDIQTNLPFSVGKENRNLSRRLTRFLEKFKGDPLEDHQRLILNPGYSESDSEFESETGSPPLPSPLDELYFDENFPEPVGVLYQDTFVTLHEDHMAIHDYFVPTPQPKQIHYREIARVYDAQEMRFSHHQSKVWGSPLAGNWWTLDKRAARKYDTMVLTLHNSKRIGVSIKDSDQIDYVKRLVQEANDSVVLIE
ncbi:hypothetical protein K493DRAFT_348118 [Basidiobolus meristosporus CBS 931.73]|uniref:Uncharacterized protein n=1 Tax=Basidiobolus meristosporus CBS 931.73 TaxID=1314790 RepID=A0A1Y1VT49_9FUNG|nr:hypothetical protein K493DRAFT_10711 [Basidiobolus meristosporus CBS 931.73]ORY00065.1 hypothetical protein K493DRAFT_348118 [Basidiobolus meristosporus CBS 931.73]|eukprot:ORX64186.1 hypothetical protein K493DRAFT_10711 [Basidiobolus meristosporus CBS 931.73]